jgi:hypothetical protein
LKESTRHWKSIYTWIVLEKGKINKKERRAINSALVEDGENSVDALNSIGIPKSGEDKSQPKPICIADEPKFFNEPSI